MNHFPKNYVKYSPIAPLHMLEALQAINQLGDYLLLLAHDVLTDPMGYEALMGYCKIGNGKPFIIMDNGTVELGNPLPSEDVLKAAAVVGADCVVLPDVIGNGTATKARINKDLGVLQASDFPLMYVPQGRNMSEFISTAEWLLRMPAKPQSNYWGIPRWLTGAREFGSRKGAINTINSLHKKPGAITPHIHLLGMSSNLTDDLECCQMKNVMGIDSANPLVMGQYFRDLSRGDHWVHMDRGEYWEKGALSGATLSNINWIRHQISGN